MRPFENLTGIDEDAAREASAKLLSTPATAIFFTAAPHDDVSHWLMADPSKRSINYHDHSWDMLEPVLADYSARGDRALLQSALALARTWIAHFSTVQARQAPVGDTHMAWYDMAVGLRAYRLAYLLDAGRDAGILSPQDDAALWSSLLQHADYLADDANIVFHNNHGFFQAAGQLAMGRRFDDRDPAMHRARLQGEERFRRMLDVQFSSEGVHLEHSPDYHRMVYRTAKAVVDQGLVSDEQTLARIEQIERALAWFIAPSGRIVNLGDSERTSMRLASRVAAERWNTPEMQFAASNGAVGARPAETVRAFAEGGYLVARIASGPSADPSRDSYLLQQAAFHSRTHKHADTLGFVWYDRGRPLLVDAGRYGYGSKTAEGSALREEGFWYSDPNRVYCERTRAHNCLEFDGRDYERRGIAPFGSVVGRTASLGDDALVAFETEARHFRGMRHVRLLFLKAGQWLVCLDWFNDGHGTAHDAIQWFHFNPSIQLETDGEHAFVEGGDRDDPLRVLPLLDVAKAERVRGQREPHMQGWWSPSARNIEPNDAVGYHVAGRSCATVATLFVFADAATPERATSHVAASGRHGTLSWRTGNAVHHLAFKRPSAGPFEIDYRVA